MSAINLKNITIEQRTTINGETFFIIKDNQVYFCFQNKLKERWQELVNNYEKISEVEIEYIENERGNKVISLYTNQEGDIII